MAIVLSFSSVGLPPSRQPVLRSREASGRAEIIVFPGASLLTLKVVGAGGVNARPGLEPAIGSGRCA